MLRFFQQKNKNIFLSTFLICLLLSCKYNVEEVQGNTTLGSMNVMAYYVPESNFQPDSLPLDKLTHIIFSFTKVIDGEMRFQNEGYREKLKALVDMRKKFPKLKVMIACGGWGADGFSDAAETLESRERFVNSVIAFNKQYRLDGLDMDWEYPGIPAAGTRARQEDKENFTALMKALREGLDTLERKQILTFASAGWERYYDHVELDQVMKYADFMNVMTYDQAGGGSKFTMHHTALGQKEWNNIKTVDAKQFIEAQTLQMEKSGKEYKPQSVEGIIDFCLKKGVKPEQLIIGAAFYGRAWKGVANVNNGLYQSNSGPYTGGIGYKDLRSKYEQNPSFVRYWDDKAKAPYLFSANDSIFITYDDTVSVRLKTEFVKEKSLGGIMFWQLGHDTKEKESLLDAIFNGVIKK